MLRAPKPASDIDDIGTVADLERFIPCADFVAVATPLTHITRNLMGADATAYMKKHTVFADVSRGGGMDQPLCARHWSAVTMHGAVVDVFETEPLPAASHL